jgi:hypothetical protein
MGKYLLIYHGGRSPETDAQREAETAAWTGWFTGMGEATVDAGDPIAQTKTVASDGSATDDGGANPATGYSILSAGSLDEAVALARGCPHLASGGSVEVAELLHIM